ncbi:MAG: ribonuclease [Clostridia bacterium]|nr:ribonuclease [Clostridia bacterium]
MDWEKRLQAQGVNYIAGVDEAGRGPLAGPVAAGAVILPVGFIFADIKDSKKLSPASRLILAEEIKKKCVAWAVGWASVAEIDSLNILAATRLAMRRALEGLKVRPQHVLTDAVNLPGLKIPVTPLVDGDNLSASIAAASILAKVARDELMQVYDSLFPGYGFSRHKGYATPDHREAIRKYGMSLLHRRSFVGLGLKNNFLKRDLLKCSE